MSNIQNGCVKQGYLFCLATVNLDRVSGIHDISYVVLKDLISSCIMMLQVYVLTFDLPLPSLLTVFATVFFSWYYIINLNGCCPLVRPYTF